MRQRRTTAALGTLLLAATLILATGPAQADDPQPPAGDPQPPAPFTSWEGLYAEQAERSGQWEAIQAAAAAAGDQRYAGTNLDPTAPTVVIRWKGAPSPAVQAAITAQGAINPITLIATAAYSERELVDEALRIGQTYPAYSSVTPNPDASGLTAVFNPGATNTTLAAQTIATAAVALTISPTEAPEQPQPLSRQNDSSPWKGGARTANCTTGFAVTKGGSAYLLYAAHCLETSTQVRDGGGDVIGTGSNRNIPRDTALVSVTNADGRVWDGGPQSNYHKPVKARERALVGKYFCASGALTGVVCNNQITHTGVSHGSVGPLARFVNRSGRPTVGQGDSGGPMYMTRTDGGVTALGILSSGDPDRRLTYCTGEGNRKCYMGGHMIDVVQFTDLYGATLRTG